MNIVKVNVFSNNKQWPRVLKEVLEKDKSVVNVDVNEEKQKARISIDRAINIELFNQLLASGDIKLSVYEVETVDHRPTIIPESISSEPIRIEKNIECQYMDVKIDGMTCRSCEITIERKFKKIEGVVKINVNATKGEARIVYNSINAPSLDRLQAAIAPDGYHVRSHNKSQSARLSAAGVSGDLNEKHQKLTASQLIGLFVIVLAVLWMLSKAGLFKTGIVIGPSTGFWTVFFIGLVAASSSCIAVSGGLLLSSAARFHERFGTSGLSRMYPVYMFVIGRTIAYGVLGGLIGYLGKSLALPQFVTGIIALMAALYMFVMGLEMLHIAPAWLRAFLPRMASKELSHKVLDAGHNSSHPLAPFMLGAATFFLPCGFTQALQLYALTTGSPATSAMLLFGFALGTAPALLALGWASSSLKGKIGVWFFRFAGALVVVLGLYNIQNSLTILGYPLPIFSFNVSAANQNSTNDSNVRFDGKQQIVKMIVDGGRYSPDEFTVTSGIPVRWEIDATNGGGCASVIQARDFGINKFIGSNPNNVIEFTPDKPGRYLFSCSMGMYRGYINVVSK